MLKRLLEGREYAYPVKCSPDNVFKFIGPVIFVSNYGIEGIKDNALLSRLQVVYADCFVKDGSLQEVPEIKKEPEEILDASFLSVSSASYVSE